ncbi:MAG TPA: hypothetical protein VGL65_04705 [Gemmatimonadales bacterium]
MAAPVLRPLSTGEVLDVSFGLYRSLYAPLVLVALVTRVLPIVINIYIQAAGGALVHLWLTLANIFLSFVLGAFAIAASTFIVSAAYLGETITAEDALSRTIPLLWPLILLQLMVGLVTAMGFILLVIPGIILVAGLMLGTVALVLEQPLSATGAMSRSWELTRGFRGKALLTLFVASLLFVVPLMVVAVVGGVLSAVGLTSRLAVEILTGVLGVFVYPYVYVVLTVLYYDLRVRKEGFDLELLTAATQPA